MANQATLATMTRIEDMIFLIRGQRVMLDFDLAKVYGVSTKRLKEQFRRNIKKFPKDFAFQLEDQEFAILRSQIATSRLHGGLRYPPTAFTEHGALMLATILNSSVAVEASVRVVRTFILMREELTANKELAGKLAELESESADTTEPSRVCSKQFASWLSRRCRRTDGKSVFTFGKLRRRIE